MKIFKYPHVKDIWVTYLSKFVKRYGKSKLERARELFEHAVEEVCICQYVLFVQLTNITLVFYDIILNCKFNSSLLQYGKFIDGHFWNSMICCFNWHVRFSTDVSKSHEFFLVFLQLPY